MVHIKLLIKIKTSLFRNVEISYLCQSCGSPRMSCKNEFRHFFLVSMSFKLKFDPKITLDGKGYFKTFWLVLTRSCFKLKKSENLLFTFHDVFFD